jgi:PAS domain S-box-containing protein
MRQRESVKILLVDDGEKNLLALEALLGEDGVDLFKARSGAEALELMLLHDFGLALLDVQMPGMDGFELAQLMRGTERTRRIPIIFLTAVATDERRRFHGYETGAVDYLLKPLDPQTLRNKVAVFVELERQRHDLARQRDELRTSAESLSAALSRLQSHADNSPLAIVEFDPSMQIINWSKGAERLFGWPAAEIIGRRIHELQWLHDNTRTVFSALVNEMMAGKQPRTVKFAQIDRRDGSAVECEWYLSALQDPSGQPISVNAQILDVTERKRAEETQQLLIGELNHRVKNTLATVQAIATQTLRHSPNPKDFATNFAGRIQVLARAHSLLSDAVWRGAEFTDLVSDQLRLGTIDERRLTISGPRVFLSPQIALHLALILHELATNANKYGALSSPEGTIALSWAVADERLSIQWIESGASSVTAPSRKGFGTILIEQSVKAEGGAARASYRADGVTWELSLPLPRSAAHYMADRMPGMAASANNSTVEQESGTTAPANPLCRKHLLVIEDEPLVAIEIETVLVDAGADITVAGSASQALHHIEHSHFHAALLDGNLHGSSVEEIAAALTRKKIPFAFVTGYGKQNLPRSFSGASVVTKPFVPFELVDAASKLLQHCTTIVRLSQYSSN